MLTAPAETVRRARTLRRGMSLPEILLWRELRKRPGGLKFRKQHPAGFFVLDFFCAEARLAIEVDGEPHSRGGQPAFDAARDAQLGLHGIATVRIAAADVLNNLEDVMVHMVEAARTRLPLRQPCGLPPPRSGEDFV